MNQVEQKSDQGRLILYMHAGSGNHGCEAIVNSLCHMLQTPPLVLTNCEAEDRRYSLGTSGEKPLCVLSEEKHFSRHRLTHVMYYLWRKLTGDRESFLRYRYQAVFPRPLSGKGKSGRNCLAVSIGGDNYCYDTMVRDLQLANRAFHQREAGTVLLGCSIEPELLQEPGWKEDMNLYDLIIARESITREALGKIVPEEKLRLIPDPAFTLRAKLSPLPEGFAPGNTIGINISPMIQDSEGKAGITMKNYEALLEHIIDTTEFQIALIPHVVWERNDDRKPIRQLWERFRDTGRVVCIPDGDCMELKGYISRCRMFIGARTHATIAAYSSLVPVLVVGYSVKARGIARDLFGTEEHYVLPVQQLEQKEDLIHAFEWLKAHETQIREHLGKVMPDYQQRAGKAGEEIERLWEEFNTRQKI